MGQWKTVNLNLFRIFLFRFGFWRLGLSIVMGSEIWRWLFVLFVGNNSSLPTFALFIGAGDDFFLYLLNGRGILKHCTDCTVEPFDTDQLVTLLS